MSDFLERQENLNVMQELQKKAQQLQLQELKVENIRMQLEEAEKQLFALRTSIADEFHTNGVTSIADTEGHVYALTTVSQCNITKKDKNKVCEWLRKVGAGHLVKNELHLEGRHIPFLQEHGIPFEEVTDANTNAVKSFVIGALGQKESPALVVDGKPLTIGDLPQGLNLFQYDTVVVK